MPDQNKYEAVFNRLKAILASYAPHLTVTADTPDSYSLDAAYSPRYGRVVFFGSAQIKKRYVSYYLMPVYVFPDLLDAVSPGLKKRMQGKSCFNLAAVDEVLVSELAELTQKGFERYRREGLIQNSESAAGEER